MRTKDHVVPKSKGGIATVDSCLRCNQSKADRSLEQFRALRGGIEFWGERAARIESEKVNWIKTFDPKTKTLSDSAPSVIQSITKEVKPLRDSSVHNQNNNPFNSSLPRLSGTKFGAFTVCNWLFGQGRWEVVCVCGVKDLRTTRAIRNPSNVADACKDCRQKMFKIRHNEWLETGVEMTPEQTLQRFLDKIKGSSDETEHIRNREDSILSEHKILEEILQELRFIRQKLSRPTPTSITFKELTMTPTEAGQTQVFTGTITPTGAAFPAGTTFTIVSNDPAVTPAVDETGLIVSVTYPTGWVESTTTPLEFTWSTSTFTPEPSTSPASLTATITPSAPPVVTPTPLGVSFNQTT